jgi:hypothetical protein
MPVTYKIDIKERLICTQCVGLVTLAEVVDHFQELGRDPNCAGHLDVLLDLSETNTVPKTAEIQAIPYEIARIREKVRFQACAIVALRDPLFGMLRMFEVMAQQYFRVIHVFRSMAEAEEWLVSERRQPSQVGGSPISAGTTSGAGNEA